MENKIPHSILAHDSLAIEVKLILRLTMAFNLNLTAEQMME